MPDIDKAIKEAHELREHDEAYYREHGTTPLEDMKEGRPLKPMLRDEIAELVYGEHHPNDITWHNCRSKADQILALLAPELEKARLWDRVKEIAESDDCILCPKFDQCQEDIYSQDVAHCPFEVIAYALEAEVTDDERGTK